MLPQSKKKEEKRFSSLYGHHHYASRKNSIFAVVAATALIVSLIMPFAGQMTGTVPSASAAGKAELPRHHNHHGNGNDDNNDESDGSRNRKGGAERTTNAAACNCVIFRLDDVQDDWIVPVQSAIIDKFLEKKAPLDLAVIMNATGSDPAIVTKVRQAVSSGLAETALHGWDHVDYRNLTLQEQRDTLKAANQKMQDLFGRKSVTFVPPYNAYDQDTLKAMGQLGLKILSAEFDQELPSIYDPDNPDSPDNKVYKAIAGSNNNNIADSQGVYHLPQVVGFYTYDSDPPTKTPLSLIKSQIDKTIASYGYAVVTLHPQDFTVKDASNNPTEELSKKEIKDLDTLITWVKDSRSYSIQTFSRASHVQLRPIIDKVPPDIMPPADKAIVSTSKLARVNSIGSPTVSDNADPNPSVKNNATRLGIGTTSPSSSSSYSFKQGTTKVIWTATDKAGNRSNATQYVTVAPAADKTAPTVEIDSPANGTIITSKADASSSSVQVQISGMAFDSGGSGVKVVEVRTNDTEYKVADQVVPGSWSSWTATVQTSQSAGDIEVEVRATDFFGNQQWDTHVIRISPSG